MRLRTSFQFSKIPSAPMGCLLCALFFAHSILAEAQQPDKIPRIGFVQRRVAPSAANPDPLGEAFLQGLKELGYIDGKNILIERRFAEGMSNRLPALIAELVQLRVDLLVVPGSAAIRAAKQATQTTPIVMITTGDPVAAGYVKTLARPGGNITGLTRLTRDLRGKRLEILKESIPGISRVAVLGGGTWADYLPDYEFAASTLRLTIQFLEIDGAKPNFDAAFDTAVKARVNALLTIRDGLTASYAKRIADLAIKSRLPSMHEDSPYVEAGGLMSYATNDADQFKRAALYVDKILKGAKPADIPVEQPSKFEFVINLKTAKQIGLTIPPNILARADRVIR